MTKNKFTAKNKFSLIAATVAFFSLTASAAPVIDPVEVAPPVEITPGQPLELVPIQAPPIIKPKSISADPHTIGKPEIVVPPSLVDEGKTVKPNDAFDNMTTKAQSCSSEELAKQMTDGTSVSYDDALAAIKFWGSRISIGTCHAEMGGLVSYEAAARENFLKAAINSMNSLKGKGDYSAADAKQAWANSFSSVLGVSVSKAIETMTSLATNCHILNASLIQ